MDKKKQHLVPNCYLKPWCDPTTPDGHEPYIWIHPSDGGEPKRKSPRKSFNATDRYTIQSPNGDRNLRVEDTLANIETRFVGIREQLESARQISAKDRFLLCAFVAAMCTRTKPAGEHWATTWKDVRSQANRLAQTHGSELDSPQLDDAVRNAYAHIVDVGIEVLTPMVFDMMYVGIYYAENRGLFITSDHPSVWYDPDSYKRPPVHRTPALCYPNVKILLPLSPNSLLMFVRDKRYAGYFSAKQQFIDEVNRFIRFNSHEYFVTRDGRTNSFWFEPRDLPADAWENTAEGKTTLARAEHYKKMEREWEASKLRQPGKETITP